ncbi:ATP-binding protein [Parendozoicomonas haliclonae]|uniref:histidine kinase n=1 Tax=Parendozoicomonas haliclonae TaxID=1960125 RepID=A0A1X7APL7_9GAMM|nr:ATP-binding protein [Parendozoicomonas haliclonae]SMA50236.1 Sensor protein CreC [Parendozoicomonas haliclonae]
MKLGRQLLVVSLLLLALPLAGVRWVQEMELTYREQQVQVLNASLRSMAASLALQGLLPESINGNGSVYVQPVSSPLLIDGYFEDWKARDLTSRPYADAGHPDFSARVFTAIHSSTLYLAFQVHTGNVVYFAPQGSHQFSSDRIELLTGSAVPDKAVQRYSITTEAPGPVVPRLITNISSQPTFRENRIRGYWRDIPDGYQLELAIPISLLPVSDDGFRHFGFRILDGTGKGVISSFASQPTVNTLPGVLVLPDEPLTQALEPFLEDDLRLGVIDNAGWQIAKTRVGHTEDHHQEEPFWLISWVYRKILSWNNIPEYQAGWRTGSWQNSPLKSVLAGEPSAVWRRQNDNYMLLAAWPLIKQGEDQDPQIVGALIAEQGSDAIMALASRSFNRLFSLSLLVIVLVAGGLLGYASWLSLRIRKLNQATERFFQDGREGRSTLEFPVSTSRDELGELSRSIAAMIRRQQEHTEYLRTLGSKLSHELRTPLAVVRSSLDNLSHESLNDKGQMYASRALDGADRLGLILNSISEATRLENMIASDADLQEFETVDLAAMLSDLFQAYSAIYPDARFQLSSPQASCPVRIIPELVVQAMDKLVANAVDFCSEQGEVTLGLQANGRGYCLTVANDGDLLPEAMQGRLFESMVSVRKTRDEKPHLGLGLYIARLVMEKHGGSIVGENRTANNGVIFSLNFPAQ